MDYNIIATGSSGNAVLINDSILIDCGVTWKMIEPYAEEIKLVLLTHEHGDHFKPSTVRALHRERPAVRWGCCEWMVEPLVAAGVSKRQIDALSLEKLHSYIFYGGGKEPMQTLIQCSEIPHNVRNCCYRIVLPDNTHLFYATDCATLDGIEAKNYDLYMIEANHTRAEIAERIAAKQAAGEYAYELEAMRNHLSREQAEDWLARNAGPNSKYVFLHQHKDKGAFL